MNGIVKVCSLAAFFLFSVWAALEDARTGEVSRRGLWLGILAAFLWNLVTRGRNGLAEASIGAGLGLGLFLFARFCSRGRLGLADVWYAAFLGTVLGPRGLYAAVGIGCFGAAAFLLITRRRRAPFIPFLAGGGGFVLPVLLFGGQA